MFLASSYTPSLNPFGPEAFLALVVVFSLAVLSSRPVPWVIRRTILLIGPLLLLAISAVTDGSLVFSSWSRGRNFLDLPDYLAGILYLAFGFGLALANFREPGLRYRVNGTVFTFIFGSYVAFFLGIFVARAFDAMLLIFVVMAAFVLAWTLVAVWLNRRALRMARRGANCCERCGYDLRGSIGRLACPECGETLPQDKKHKERQDGRISSIDQL